MMIFGFAGLGFLAYRRKSKPALMAACKPCRIVNRCLEGERSDRTDARYGHKPADLRIMARQFHNLVGAERKT